MTVLVSARIRFLVAALVVVAMYVRDSDQVLSAASVRHPDCGSYCGESRECDVQCWQPVGESQQLITCGEYDGGWLNDMCNGNSCVLGCGPTVPCDDACYYEGSPTTCGEYTEYEGCASCGDYVCATLAGESRTTCPADCGDPALYEPVCGEYGCEAGESFRNCPEDCEDPGAIEDDHICNGYEDPFSDDCLCPYEMCNSTTWPCPPYYQCVNGSCIYDDGIEVLQTCDFEDPDCGPGFSCQQMYDVMGYPAYQPVYVCKSTCVPPYDAGCTPPAAEACEPSSSRSRH